MTDPILNELRGMLIFARVVEAGSFSAAAERLGVSRAVVSYQIKQLEQRLGIRLLNRSTRRLSLTAAGRQYFDSCHRIADEAKTAHRLIQNLQDEPVGHLSIACPVNLGIQWIVPIVSEFRQRYPSIELDLNLSESLVNLIEEGIDLAIRAGPLVDSELKSIKLATSSRRMCAAPSYLRQRGRPQQLEQLADHEWIIYSRMSSQLNLIKDNKSYTLNIQGKLRTNNAAARLQFALAGHGIALLPHYDVYQALEKGELIELFSEYQLPALDLFAVFPTGSTHTRASRLLLDMLREHPLTQRIQ